MVAAQTVNIGQSSVVHDRIFLSLPVPNLLSVEYSENLMPKGCVHYVKG